MATYDMTSSTVTSFKAGDILNFPYSGSANSVSLGKGVYKLECWGAQGGKGGSSYSYEGGKGGYSVGNIEITNNTNLYIYSGGVGGTNSSSYSYGTTSGGFNGGGTVVSYGYCGGGGGASDIRIGTDSLYARVIVAGGGGGAGWSYVGGVGGGESGISSYSTSYNSTQTNGGSAYNSSGSYQTVTAGSFGVGGNGSGSSQGGSGGGGGWYGGGGAGYTGGSAGGSGYIYTSSTASNYPSGCLLNSSYYLTDASTTAGNTSFTSPTNTSETGHSDSGYCRITVLKCGPYINTFYVKVNGSWIEL